MPSLATNKQLLSLKQEKCLPCKLFTAPLMFMLGGYFAFRNKEIWTTEFRSQDSNKMAQLKGQYRAEMPSDFRRFGKVALISIPVIFFAIGSHLLYDAYKIFKHQQLCIEVQELLQQADILSDSKSL